MISNERSGGYSGGGGGGYRGGRGFSTEQRPRMECSTLAEKTFPADRKEITIAVMKNANGTFMRITEKKGAMKSFVVIPDVAVPQFMEVLAEMSDAVTGGS